MAGKLLSHRLIARTCALGSRHQSASAAVRHGSKLPPFQVDPYASRRLDSSSADNFMDIGIRRIFNSDHDIFRASVRKFLQEELVPNTPKYEEQGFVDKEFWRKAGEQGLLGVNIPAEDGGIGGGFLDTVITWEELCYVNDFYCGFSVHSDIVMPYLSHLGTKEQKEKYIPRMVSGEVIGSIVMTEPGAGSDLQGIRTNAVKKGDDYILNGSKVFITNGYNCGLAVVVAVTDPSAKSPAQGGLSLFLVEEGMPGFVKGRTLKKMGMKGQDTAELFFEDVRLSKEHLLGEEGKGFSYLMRELPQERLVIGAESQALAEYAFEITREYVTSRKAFGKTIFDLQTIQHRLAEMKTEICINRAHTDQCLIAHAEGVLDSATASMNKYWSSAMLMRVANECVQMHGGWGYMMEYPICRLFTTARCQPIYGGTNEIMKELIARTI